MTAEERLALAERALTRSRADATDVTVIANHRALSRFTRETIHQNVDEVDVTIAVRAIVDGRVGIASTNARDDAALAAVNDRARELALLAPRDTLAPLVAAPVAVSTPPGAYVAQTAHASADRRAQIADAMFARAKEAQLWSSGYVTSEDSGITIATSAGARLGFDGTSAGANVKMNGADSTGWAESYAVDIDALDGDAVGARAARKALAARAPVAVDPGAWTVILEPAALGELLAFFRPYFSAELFAEGASYISGKLGERIAGENVTIRDDYAHPLNPGMPFDFSGAPTARLTLIDRGIARDIVTDDVWSRRLDRPNTGHAVPRAGGWPVGPQPLHTVVEPGTRSVDDLIAETPRGLLITRLWYVRYVDQRRSIVTGMTRDGTFLIEDGKLRGGVRNMRFNVAIGELLEECEFANDPTRTGGYAYSLVTPSVKFPRFRFASVSPY
jgi:predicted Zn-dependent protease